MNKAPRLSPLNVEFASEYVLGFPIHVAFELYGGGDAAFPLLPTLSAFENFGALGLSLWHRSFDKGEYHHHPTVESTPLAPDCCFSLGAGSRRRVLVDLSDLLPPSIKAGNYGAAISYGARSYGSESQKFELALREPTTEERQELSALAAEYARGGNWGNWTMGQPAFNDRPLRLPRDASDPLAFNRLIRYLYYYVTPLPKIDSEIVAPLRMSLYAPEAALLEAEILHAAKSPDFDEQAEIIRQEFPGLVWWLDEIIEGRSRFAWRRQRIEFFRTIDGLSTIMNQ